MKLCPYCHNGIPLTVRQGIVLQETHLALWRARLNAECYLALEAHAKTSHADAHCGHQISRGDTLTEFVLNYTPKR